MDGVAQESVQQDGPLKGGRQRANHIQVHRIELGLKERQYLETAGWVAGISTAGVAVAALAAAAGIGLAGYGAYWASKKAFNWAEEAAAEAQAWYDTVGGVGVTEAVVGRATYIDPTTGVTHKNPFAGVPILGSLFGSGINLGIASWRAASEVGPDSTLH